MSRRSTIPRPGRAPTPAGTPTTIGTADRVAYLVSRYPLISHTFIQTEIRGLEALGQTIDRFSVRGCPAEDLLTQEMVQEAARTSVLLTEARRTVPAAHYAALRTDPAAWAHGLRRALTTGDRTARARLWQVFYFVEAVTLLNHLRRLDTRHIHVHFANVSADVARLAVHLGRRQDGPSAGWRWSMTMHGPTEFEAVDKVDLAAKVRDADGIMAISDFARSQLMRLVEPMHWSKIRVVRMSVDERLFTPPRDARTGRESGPYRVLSVGRLVPEKGAPVLLDSLAELVRRGIDVEAVLIGSGPLQATLERHISSLGLTGKVKLLGSVGQDTIVAHYHWADVFCLPSFQEGLPVVLMEAMATELPVVTTRIAGIQELVGDGINGRVITPGRADLLADALSELHNDPDRRHSWGAAGRQAVLREFTSATTAPAMHEALQAVRSR